MLNSVGMFEERGKKVGNLVEKCEVLSVFYRLNLIMELMF